MMPILPKKRELKMGDMVKIRQDSSIHMITGIALDFYMVNLRWMDEDDIEYVDLPREQMLELENEL